MKTPDTNKILATIDSFTANDLPFTAYDITKTLRIDGFMVRHQDVKNVFDTTFTMMWDYNRTQHPTLGAWVYHPDTMSVTDYNPYEVVDVKPHSVKIKTSKLTKKVAPTNNGVVNKGGRYCLPSTYVRSASLNPHDTVYVVIDSGKITIHKHNVGLGRPLMVDCYSNIRIPKKDFEAAFDTIPSKVNITLTHTTIEIT